MTTPTRQPNGAPFQNLVPSSSFLQQLLEEINGSGTPTVVRRRTASQSAPRPEASPNEGRRASSVWVGGTSIARETRHQLRAADEARVRRDSFAVDDLPRGLLRSAPYLHALCFDAASPSSSRSSTSSSPRDPQLVGLVAPTATNQETSSAVLDESHHKSTMGGLRIPGSAAGTLQQSDPDDIDRTASPLIFCDIDSDISSTPSPTEPPTSALSAALTDATSVSDDQPRPPRDPGNAGCMFTLSPPPTMLTRTAAEKRARTPDILSGSLSKKTRTMTLPHLQSQMAHPTSRSSWRNSVGGDNRSLIRSSTFIERSPIMLDKARSVPDGALPELSSFRPGAVDSQGVPPISVTPVRPSTRRSSAIGRDPSPESDDTPIYARSLHLVDTDVSVYKKVHGDEWRQNSLCLHCFRRHGGFNKMNQHGYEVCGRSEALDSHYWETYGSDEYH
jgi:hypothetical protein